MRFKKIDPPSWASSQYRDLITAVIREPGSWFRLEDAEDHNRHAIRSAFATVMLQLHVDSEENYLYIRIRPEVLEEGYEGKPVSR